MLQKLASRESIWDSLVGQIYLGSAEWIERMRRIVESRPRSDEHPRPQRSLRRLAMEQVIRAVAHACEVSPDSLRRSRGSLPRALAAWIGWNEGLLRLREIAAALRLRSCGYVSALVKRFDAELARDAALQWLARAAIASL